MKEDNWSNVNKDSEALSYKSDLYHILSALLLNQDTHTLVGYLCLPSEVLCCSSLERMSIPSL